jgi:hypothetical protein
MTDERGHLLYLIIITGLVWTLFLITSGKLSSFLQVLEQYWGSN